MNKKDEPVTLGVAIEALVRSLGIGGKLKEYEIVDIWPGIVGERIAQVSRVESVERGVATIRVTAAPWRTELSFRKQEILEKIHDTMQSDVITDIRFR
jgi:predicted nucleic acid-binding Zn ribbon protein